MDMQESFLESRGISYRTNGFKPGRPILVFLHGLSGSLSAWHDHEAALTDKYNLLFIDLRGHGRSVRPGKYADYALSEFATDVEQVIEHLKITSCTIVAHSFGTLVALHYLLKPGCKAVSVVFLSPNYKIHGIAQTRLSRPFIAFGALAGRLFPFRAKSRSRLDYSGYRQSRDWDLRRIWTEISAMGLRPYLYSLNHIYGFKDDGLWAKIAVPTLIIHGKRDKFVPFKVGVALAEILPQAKLTLWEHACHMLVLNNQRDIDEQIKSFVPN